MPIIIMADHFAVKVTSQDTTVVQGKLVPNQTY